LLNDLKITEQLNVTLKNENLTLKERNQYLEKINTDLTDDISNNKLSQNKILEDKENKFKEMCKNYDNVSFLNCMYYINGTIYND